MLLEFMVENYKSIKNQTTLSMMARPDLTGSEEMLLSCRNQKILPAAMILGPNGSGKTALLDSIQAVQSVLRNSLKAEPGTKIDGIVPFRFRQDSDKYPSVFQLTLAIDNVKYIYGFSASQQAVQEEYLYAFYSSRATRIFERDFQSFSVTGKYRSRLRPFLSMTGPNRLLLGVAGKLGGGQTDYPLRTVYEFITKSIEVSSPSVFSRAGKSMLRESCAGDKELKRRVLDFLDTAGFGISDFSVEYEEPEWNPLLFSAYAAEASPETLRVLQDLLSADHSETRHCVSGDLYPLPMDAESNGTRKVLYLLPVLLQCLEEGGVLFVDEMETGLHPLLVKEIVSLFSSRAINQKGAQIIFTAHDAVLLETVRLREDQVFFVDRDRVRQETELYSLADFPSHGKEEYLKNYLHGRYGAIPHLLDRLDKPGV